MSPRPRDEATATPADDGSTHRPWRSPLWLVVAVVVLAALAVRAWILGVYAIPSESMQPILDVGDRVVVAKWRGGHVTRGDVVVFDGRSTWGPVQGADPAVADELLALLDGHEPRFVYVKRVIGMGGDRVTCCDRDGRVTVNGTPLEEPYLYRGDSPSEQRFDVQVPAGRLWLMGDHRSDSGDSRVHLGSPGGGTVAAADVIGPVLFRYWPLTRWGSVPTAGGSDR